MFKSTAFSRCCSRDGNFYRAWYCDKTSHTACRHLAIVGKEFYRRWRDTKRVWKRGWEKGRLLDFLLRHFPTDNTVANILSCSSMWYDLFFGFFPFMQMYTIASEICGSRNGIIVGNIIHQVRHIFPIFHLDISSTQYVDEKRNQWMASIASCARLIYSS